MYSFSSSSSSSSSSSTFPPFQQISSNLLYKLKSPPFYSTYPSNSLFSFGGTDAMFPPDEEMSSCSAIEELLREVEEEEKKEKKEKEEKIEGNENDMSLDGGRGEGEGEEEEEERKSKYEGDDDDEEEDDDCKITWVGKVDPLRKLFFTPVKVQGNKHTFPFCTICKTIVLNDKAQKEGICFYIYLYTHTHIFIVCEFSFCYFI
jgi:hypothetical protein